MVRTRVKLGDVADLTTGFPFKSSEYVEDTNCPRLLRGDNIVQGRIRWDGVKRWPVDKTHDLGQYWLAEGDIALAMDRPWIEAGLKFCAILMEDMPSLLVQRVARLRATEKLHNGFLRYTIGSRSFTDHILAVQTGSVVPHISGKSISGFEFDLPPLPEQRAIASVLSALDDKIELNRRMNGTLEAMARALFRDWFVDFGPTRAKMALSDAENGKGAKNDQTSAAPTLSPEIWSLFPDRLDDDGVPEGWEEKPLDEIAQFLNGLALQKFPSSVDEDYLPVIKIAELRNGTSAKTNKASREVPEKYVIQDGDFIFSWSGSLMAKFWTGDEGALNQHLFKVTSKDYPAWFYSQWVFHHLAEFQSIAQSKATTMGHIQRGHLKAATTICPPADVLEKIGAVIAPLVTKAISNELESRTLAQTRDLLLPKLMSGEIRVREAEAIVEDAG